MVSNTTVLWPCNRTALESNDLFDKLSRKYAKVAKQNMRTK